MAITGSFTWSKEFEELKQALAHMPERLAAEADKIVESHANGAAVAVRRVYGQHRVTGYLQNHVFVTQFLKGKFMAGHHVRNTSPHAWLFDNGTQARHYTGTDKRGRVFINAARGAMWGGPGRGQHVFVNTMSKFRRAMYLELRGLLERAGLLVSGDERAA
jgi:hypothetical protein